MALDLNTVNTAYLAFLGRPAEGKAYEWASGFASNSELMDSIVLAQIPQNADFVESLYNSNRCNCF